MKKLYYIAIAVLAVVLSATAVNAINGNVVKEEKKDAIINIYDGGVIYYTEEEEKGLTTYKEKKLGLATYSDLIIDTSLLYVDADTDKIGIGTTTATTLLDIYGGDIWMEDSDAYLYMGNNKNDGIKLDGGVMKYCEDGTCTAFSSSANASDIWVATGDNLSAYPRSNDDSNGYIMIVKGKSSATATSSPADASTALFAPDTTNVVFHDVYTDGSSVFNEDSADEDFRVESNGDAYMVFVDAGNDKVGIGTSSPTYTLDIDGSAAVNDYIYHADNDADTYIGFDASDAFIAKIGNEEMIDITEDGSQDIIEFGDGGDIDMDFNDMMHIVGSTGFVGIGDDTTADTMLEVVDATAPQVTIAHTDATDYYTIDVDSNGDVTIIASGGDIDWDDENLSTTGTLASGNYTLTGTLTGSGDVTIDTSDLVVDVSENNTGVGSSTPGYTLSVTSTDTYQVGIGYNSTNYSLLGVSSGGDLTIDASGSDVLIPDQVSIATSTASAYALDVYGDVRIGETGNASAFTIDAGTGAIIINEDSASTADVRIEGDSLTSLFHADASADRVGIGTSTPYATLSVESQAGDSGFVIGSSTATYLEVDNDGDLIVDTDTLLVDNSADRVGISTSTPSADFAVGSGTATSSVDFGLPCFRMKATDGTTLYMWPQLNANDYSNWATSTASCF